ncbi:acyltransferase [Candidatus Curtissbacteria bacterium]|nr:acyltransferase [Candidatus Curtissbacteria bacterium]
MPKRIAAIDILKALAIIAVILIHTTSVSFNYVKLASIQNLLIFDQFLRFSVPLFVATSGYLLAIKYLNQNLKLSEFFQKRALKLLPSYLVWTAIIYIYLHYFTHEPQQHYSLFEIIFLGRADYHLYFVPMLFQLYLLFPVILYLYKKNRAATILGTLIIQLSVIAFSLAIRNQTIKVNFLWGDQQQYLFCLTWVFYFTLGILIFDLKNKERFKKLPLITLGLTLAGFYAAVSQSITIFTKTHQLIDATTFTRYPIVLFASGAISSVLLFGEKLESLFEPVKNFFAAIGKSSYTIYLMHTIVLRIVYNKLFIGENHPNLWLFPVLVVTISVLTSLLITYTTKIITNQLAFLKPRFH